MKMTRTIWGLVILAVLIAVVVFGAAMFSQGESQNKDKAGKTNGSAMSVTVEGELQAKVEIGGGSGAKSDSKLTFKVNKAVREDGHELADLQGEFLSFAENAKGKDLIGQHRNGEQLVINGSLNLQEKMLTVKSFKKAEARSGAKSQGSDSK